MRYPSSFVLAVFGLLALWPVVTGSYGTDLVAKIMIYALLALSLELLVGSTGLVCFGQAAFFWGALCACTAKPIAHNTDTRRKFFRTLEKYIFNLLRARSQTANGLA
mgnify:CR=1 FL=1